MRIDTERGRDDVTESGRFPATSGATRRPSCFLVHAPALSTNRRPRR